MKYSFKKSPKMIYKMLVASLYFLVLLPLTTNADHQWSTYHWAVKWDAVDYSVLPLPVIDSVTGAWDNELTAAIDAWNTCSVPSSELSNDPICSDYPDHLEMFIDSSNDSSKTRKRCRMSAGKMRVCNASYGRNGWSGMASINLDSNGHITQGTAKMNDSYSFNQAEKNHVMCQEVGHVFGLGHTSVNGTSQSTCMDYADNSDNSQAPNLHDFEELHNMYSHDDGYNSYASAEDVTEPEPDPEPDTKPCRGPAWKCPDNGLSADKGNSDFGRGHLAWSSDYHEVWVEYHKDGTMTVHHVTLAR